jgi:hypothetical protein
MFGLMARMSGFVVDASDSSDSESDSDGDNVNPPNPHQDDQPDVVNL